MKTVKEILLCVVLLSVIVLVVFLGFNRPKESIIYQFETDTLYLRDTIRPVIPPPDTVYIVRLDTLFVTVQDTMKIQVFLPIERKEIKTPDFKAVIEGYKPSLISMELYPETKIINNNTTRIIKPKFGIGIQAGMGLSGKEFRPYIGIGIQYNLMTF